MIVEAQVGATPLPPLTLTLPSRAKIDPASYDSRRWPRTLAEAIRSRRPRWPPVTLAETDGAK